ncbi:MAG: methylmalonyl-CoA decarboxylase [Candidatus Riflebacteria bacterium]|nr:methylmalonyl-CoA decarboxylase [Candidatus Riflebacteria bacterium]
MAYTRTEFSDQIGTITLTHSQKRNALNRELLKEVVASLHDLENRKARVVIIRAEKGSKVWSAGHDISERPMPGRDPLGYDDPLELAIRTIERLGAPVIALLEGTVWGGACELAFTCDILIGTPDVTFAITPAKIGVPYNPTGVLHFMSLAGMSVIKEMFFTAQPISAERASDVGIVNHIVPADQIEEYTYTMARQIAQNSPLSISVIKEQIRMLGKAHPLSPETFERIQGLRRKVYDSADYREGPAAFLEKRRPRFTGE